jgi:hypothetical protein
MTTFKGNQVKKCTYLLAISGMLVTVLKAS